MITGPEHDKTNKMTCSHSKDSDQPDQSLLCAIWGGRED